jgi:hypothetical protein
MHFSVENLRIRVGQDHNRQKLLLGELVPSWLTSTGRQIILRPLHLVTSRQFVLLEPSNAEDGTKV